jgi:hypothetical protein
MDSLSEVWCVAMPHVPRHIPSTITCSAYYVLSLVLQGTAISIASARVIGELRTEPPQAIPIGCHPALHRLSPCRPCAGDPQPRPTGPKTPPQKSPLGYTSRCEDPVGFGCRPSCLLVWHWPLGQASRGYQGSDSINYILDQSVNDYYFLHRGIRFTRLGPDPPPSDKRTVSRAAAPVKKMYYRLADEWPSSTLTHIHSVGELSLHHETLRTTQPYRSTHPPSAWREAGQNLPW